MKLELLANKKTFTNEKGEVIAYNDYYLRGPDGVEVNIKISKLDKAIIKKVWKL